MKNNFLILFIFLFCCSTNRVDFEKKEFDFIKVNILGVYENKDKVNSQLVISIPNNKMVFHKVANGFESNLSLNIIVNDMNNNIVLNETWNELINEDFFEDTKSDNKLIINRSILLNKGEYSLNLFVNDFNNHLSWYKKYDFIVDGKLVFPEITIFHKKNNDYKYIPNDQILDLDTIWISTLNNVNNNNFKIEYNFYSTSLDTSFIVYKGITEAQNSRYIPIEIIDEYFNTLDINIFYNETSKKKVINFNRLEEVDYDYNLVVGPMDYLLENTSFSTYRKYNSLNDSSKIQFIIDYWDIKDGEYNDLFKEFYNRVLMTNKKFGYSSSMGWESDRGRIYIIYGKPIDIKNQFDIDGDYEIWVYKNNLQFIFINRYGIYELYNQNY